MRFRWLIMCVLGAALVKPAAAQVSAYVDLSASKLTNLVGTNVLYGPTIGLTAQVANKAHLKLYADIRGEFLGGSNRLDGLALGPKLGLPIKKFEAYAEILVGFARYNDGLGKPASATTDAQTEVNFGLDRRVSQRLDWRVFDYGYTQYYALGGQFNPKTFSTGVVVHIGAR